MVTIRKSKKGTSLVEAVVAISVLSIIIVGSSLLFVSGQSYIDMRGRHRIAAELAAQKLEELKAGNYNDITEGETEESFSLDDLPYTRSVATETRDGGLYKKVQVTVSWQQIGKQRNVSLATFIAPK